MKRTLFAVLATGLILGMSGPALAADKLSFETVQLTGPAGEKVDAKALLAGKTSVISFAQTACANCRDELTYLVSLQKDFFQNVQLVAAIMDMRPDQKRIEAYLGELGFQGKVLTDPKFALAKELGVNSTPSLVILDKDGVVIFRHFGFDQDAKPKIKKALDIK